MATGPRGSAKANRTAPPAPKRPAPKRPASPVRPPAPALVGMGAGRSAAPVGPIVGEPVPTGSVPDGPIRGGPIAHRPAAVGTGPAPSATFHRAQAASEWAASEWAASEWAASEWAASERAASERAASERAASERAASERAAPGQDLARGVRSVVRAMAPLLGLDPLCVPVTVLAVAGEPHGAARRDRLVFTGRLDLSAPPSRSLVVHELAHLRQHRNLRDGARRTPAPDVTAAEAEAAGLAAAAREGRPLWVPRQVLPSGHEARDRGASGITLDTGDTGTPTVERDLEAIVPQNHLDQVQVLAAQLDPRQGPQVGDAAENSLRALTTLRFVVARALIRALRPEVRRRLAQVQDEHHAKYPEACVAVLSALTSDDLRLLPAPADRTGGNGAAAALRGVDPDRLPTAAHRALLATLRRLPAAARAELEHGDRGDLFGGLLRTPPDPGTDAAELAAALRSEELLARQRRSGAAAPQGQTAATEGQTTAAAGEEPAAKGASPKGSPTPERGTRGPEGGPEAELGAVPETAPGALPRAEPGTPPSTGAAGAGPAPAALGGPGPGPAGPRRVDLLMPPPPAAPGPDQRQRLGKVEHGAATAARRSKSLPTAPQAVGAARGAVKEPPAETKARAGMRLADALGDRDQPIAELVTLGDEIVAAIKARRPPEVEDLTASKANQAAQDAGQTITASVGQDVTRVQGSYDSLRPDPSGTPALKPTEIHTPGTHVTDPGIAAPSAAADPVPAEDLSLDADRDAVEAKAAQARMDRHSAEPLQNTPPFSEAAQGRAQLAQLAANGPAQVAKQQADAIAKAQGDMEDLQSQALEALTAARSGTVTDVHSGQRGLVGHEEKTRASISGQALDCYNAARDKIEPLLRKLPGTALDLWTTGLDRLSGEFTAHLARVQGWIDDRHSGVGGYFLGKWDNWTGLPDWVPEEYDAAELAFGEGVRRLLLDISREVNSVLAAAEVIIQEAREKIDTLFSDLPGDLQGWAEGERKRFDGQLDALSGQVAEVRTSFVRDISQRAVSSVTDVQEKVEALRAEARGVIGRVLDAIEAFLDDPVKTIINGLLNLLNIPPRSFWALVDKIAAVVDQIADDPETFINNLMKGIRDGFGLFFDHFPTHLREGFWAWLTSKLGPTDVRPPTDVSPAGLFAFALELMGLSWTNVREILVRHIGEKNVELIEKALELISTLVQKGPAGIVEMLKDRLHPATVIDTIVSAATDYTVKRLIRTVSVKVLELFNPAGAVLEAIELTYRILRWVFENAARIFTLVETVVNGIADVLAGNVGKLALAVEKALSGLIAPVIDFLAGWLSLDDLPEEIAGVVKSLQSVVLAATDQVVGTLAERAKGLLASLGVGGRPAAGGAEDEELGTTVRFSAAGETHRLYVEASGPAAHLVVASVPEQVAKKIDEWRAKIAAKEPASQAKRTRASGLLDTLRPIVENADQEAAELAKEFLAARAKRGEGHGLPSDDHLENRERAVAGILDELFTIFGEKVDTAEIVAQVRAYLPRRGRVRQAETRAAWMERIATFTIGEHEGARRLWPDGVLANVGTDALAYLGAATTAPKLVAYFTTAPGEREVETDAFDDYAFVSRSAPHTVRRDYNSMLGTAAVQQLKRVGTERLTSPGSRREVDDSYLGELQESIDKITFDADAPGGGRLRLPTEHIPEHARFKPKEVRVVERGDVRTITYRTEAGKDFVVKTDRRDGLVVTAKGFNLQLERGRGITEDSPYFSENQGFNRAHLVANEFGGSGFEKGENLATTSETYNQVTMRTAELQIGRSIRDYALDHGGDPADVEFDLTVTARFAAVADRTILAQIRKHRDFPKERLAANLEAEILGKIRAGEVHPDLQRVVRTEYTWTAWIPGRRGIAPYKDKTWIGPDLWLLTNG